MNATRHSQSDEPGSSHSLPLLYNVVYCSRATADVGDAAVERILETARKHNPVLGITGLLVFGGGIFFQWLEGPRDNVTQLMTNLKADPRHKDVVALTESEEARERLFPDWDMEFVTTDDIRDVLIDAMSTTDDVKHAEALKLLLVHLDSGELSGLTTA
jgi:hypothetical protein